MQVYPLEFNQVPQLSSRDQAYQHKTELFSEFIAFTPDEEGLLKALKERKKYPIDRALLHSVLTEQYQKWEMSALQKDHLHQLQFDHSFTIITAHQPSLFTGPLYYLYKIFSVINLCENLQKKAGDDKLIPVFIIGSEDHDFEEVNHIHLFGKKIEWNRHAGGPVGHYDLAGLTEVLEEVIQVLGNNENAATLSTLLKKSLEGSMTYNDFMFQLLNALFSRYGLLVANMDHPLFKKKFIPVMKNELLHHASESIIQGTQQALSNLGFSSQAYARAINLFYMKPGLRERIILADGHYAVHNTDIQFTEAEILQELENHPERFSPNVILRPLYEETIFPNIAYIGGGGELAYWLERKAQFQHYHVFFPALVRRDSVLLLMRQQFETMGKLGIAINDLFRSEHQLIESYLKRTVTTEFELKNQRQAVAEVFESIKTTASDIDRTLVEFIEAEHVKTQKIMEHVEARIKKSVKKNEEVNLNKIKTLKAKLFFEDGLQERRDNFMQYYVLLGDVLLDVLKQNLNPLDKNFKIIVLDK